jgi:hypothetical protein
VPLGCQAEGNGGAQATTAAGYYSEALGHESSQTILALAPAQNHGTGVFRLTGVEREQDPPHFSPSRTA